MRPSALLAPIPLLLVACELPVETVCAEGECVVVEAAPTPPFDLELGRVPLDLTRTPTIEFAPGMLGNPGAGPLRHQARVERDDGVVVAPWSDVVAGGAIAGLSLEPDTRYRLSLRAVDAEERTSAEVPSPAWRARAVQPILERTFETTVDVPAGAIVPVDGASLSISPREPGERWLVFLSVGIRNDPTYLSAQVQLSSGGQVLTEGGAYTSAPDVTGSFGDFVLIAPSVTTTVSLQLMGRNQTLHVQLIDGHLTAFPLRRDQEAHYRTIDAPVTVRDRTWSTQLVHTATVAGGDYLLLLGAVITERPDAQSVYLRWSSSGVYLPQVAETHGYDDLGSASHVVVRRITLPPGPSTVRWEGYSMARGTIEQGRTLWLSTDAISTLDLLSLPGPVPVGETTPVSVASLDVAIDEQAPGIRLAAATFDDRCVIDAMPHDRLYSLSADGRALATNLYRAPVCLLSSSFLRVWRAEELDRHLRLDVATSVAGPKEEVIVESASLLGLTP